MQGSKITAVVDPLDPRINYLCSIIEGGQELKLKGTHEGLKCTLPQSNTHFRNEQNIGE